MRLSTIPGIALDPPPSLRLCGVACVLEAIAPSGDALVQLVAGCSTRLTGVLALVLEAASQATSSPYDAVLTSVCRHYGEPPLFPARVTCERGLTYAGQG